MGCRGFITLEDVTLENLREVDDWRFGEKVGKKKVVDVCPRGVDSIEVIVTEKDIPNLQFSVPGAVTLLGQVFLYRNTYQKRDGSNGISQRLVGDDLHFGQFKKGN